MFVPFNYLVLGLCVFMPVLTPAQRLDATMSPYQSVSTEIPATISLSGTHPSSLSDTFSNATSFPRTTVATFLTPSDSFHKKRFWLSTATAATIYTGFSIGLWEAWYKDYPVGGFRTIDDSKEWMGMDKAGHIYTAFHYSRWAYQGLRWSGTPKARALVMSTATSLLLQSTVEVMDGFSKSWGFSWYDMAANAAGTGLFAAQLGLWGERRINMKVSSARQRYSTEPISPRGVDGPTSTIQNRADQLYGTTPWNRFIKDYNAQNIWLTVNPSVLLGKETKADWLTLAIGYSSDEVLGAYGNNWREGEFTYVGSDLTQRKRELALSLDIDFEKIKTNNPALKTFLHLLNHVKVPAPALLYQEGEPLAWKWLYY